jgi:hypothetical protein
MKPILQLDGLSRADKLRAMEELWADLSQVEEDFPSPAWHGEVLRSREEALKAGKEEFIVWEDAKRMLRDNRKK